MPSICTTKEGEHFTSRSMPFIWRVLFEEFTVPIILTWPLKLAKVNKGLCEFQVNWQFAFVNSTLLLALSTQSRTGNLHLAEKLDYLINKGEYRRNTGRSNSTLLALNPHHGAYFSRINTSKTGLS